MPKFQYAPFLCTSIIIHIALGGMLFFYAPQKKKPRLSPFKERIVALPPEPKITTTLQTPSPQPIRKPVKNAPAPEKKAAKPPAISNPQKSPQKPNKASPTPRNETLEKKQATLKKLAQLANQLAEEAETQESYIAQFSWPAQAQVLTENTSYQQDAFCALFQQYVSLPFPGEVRLKLEFSSEGALLHCSILSTISHADKQHILNQIQKIPFQSFFSAYKTSKNIVFHIRLQGNSA